MYEHFKQLNQSNDDDDEGFEVPDLGSSEYDDILNSQITEVEIERVVKSLKNRKAAGYDGIKNEFIKNSIQLCMPLYIKLFNFIFDTGIIPDIWSKGIIHPIYKNKGDPKDPDSYRGITLVSSLGKVYTAILNNRINKLAEEIELISKCQAGFRRGYSTIDNIFNLYCLIQIYLQSGRKLFCTFIDFKKAFDTVWRVGLWQKLISNNVNEKIFTSIRNMYSDIKSCVRQNSCFSNFFPCGVGVRQGENLSPILFALFINDLEEFFSQHNIISLELVNTQCMAEIGIYLKIFLLLYADDTVLMAETAEELQKMLDRFDEYCVKWKLHVNTTKTKVVIFQKNKQRRNPTFTLRSEELEIKDSYHYLGLLFRYNCNFNLSKKLLVEQSQKALYAIYYKIRNIDIPLDLQFKLFDCIVGPILMYASEIWGYENVDMIEKIHLNFLKRALKVRSSTPNYMVYGETGRFPLSVSIKLKMLCFWSRLLQSANGKFSSFKTTLSLEKNIY